jgi:hypothetical protein
MMEMICIEEDSALRDVQHRMILMNFHHRLQVQIEDPILDCMASTNIAPAQKHHIYLLPMIELHSSR